MSRRVVEITLDNLEHFPHTCRGCVFWELGSRYRRQGECGENELEKEAWLSSVLLDWGPCGLLLYVSDVPAGYASYGPPAVVPTAAEFPTAPVSPDAVLLTALRVLPDYQQRGLARMLIRNMVRELSRRGVQAVEAFADAEGEARCVLPEGFLRQVGFHTVRGHHRWPRMRLELPSEPAWREDVEAALERLATSVTVPATGGASGPGTPAAEGSQRG